MSLCVSLLGEYQKAPLIMSLGCPCLGTCGLQTSLNFISAIGMSRVNSAYYNHKLFTVVVIMQCVANTNIAATLPGEYASPVL